ncbi:hypothetical protein NM688_g8232 [Phlebia brevispora]|uniref:Uncharacterized protein n=1 Tax=Phlebia brevispora TaxID=194682 RepID=A0ACC1RVR5_9APHY|nr:hypothetical protein NM688_g8232 [Phlebia brevispora]
MHVKSIKGTKEPKPGRVQLTMRNVFSRVLQRCRPTPIPPSAPAIDTPVRVPTPPLDPQAFKLPCELLVAVFEEGARDTYMKEGVPFVIIVSHVCRYWRAIACSTSSLWTFVPVHAGKDEMTRLFLERSGEYPLSIYLCMQHRVARTLPPLDFIFPSASRWVSLCIGGDHLEEMYLTWILLRKMPQTPHLKHVDMRVSSRRVSCKWQIPNSFAGKQLVEGFASVLLQGLSGHSARFLCKYSGLPSDSNDPFPALKQMCGWPLPLTHLKLDGVLPISSWLRREGGMLLPSLHTLEIVLHPIRDVGELFGAIQAPALQVLSFESGQKGMWEEFVKALPVMNAQFTNLQGLRITITKPFAFDELAAASSLFSGMFCNLRELTLTASLEVQAVYFLRSWFQALSAGGQGTWQHLETLTIKVPSHDSARADPFPLTRIDHYVTLLGSLCLARCADQPLDVWLNSKCTRFSVPGPGGDDIRYKIKICLRRGVIGCSPSAVASWVGQSLLEPPSFSLYLFQHYVPSTLDTPFLSSVIQLALSTMWVAHYASGLTAKPFAPRVPLVVLCLAGALSDALFFVLQLFGIEKFNFDSAIAERRGCFPYTNYYPYSHSLAGMIIAGAILALVYRTYVRVPATLQDMAVITAASASHFLFEWPTHRADTKITPTSSTNYGAGLFDYAAVDFVVETTIFFLGLWVYLTFTRPQSQAGHRANPNLLKIVAAVMVVQQAHFCFGAAPTSQTRWVHGPLFLFEILASSWLIGLLDDQMDTSLGIKEPETLKKAK